MLGMHTHLMFRIRDALILLTGNLQCTRDCEGTRGACLRRKDQVRKPRQTEAVAVPVKPLRRPWSSVTQSSRSMMLGNGTVAFQFVLLHPD